MDGCLRLSPVKQHGLDSDPISVSVLFRSATGGPVASLARSPAVPFRPRGETTNTNRQWPRSSQCPARARPVALLLRLPEFSLRLGRRHSSTVQCPHTNARAARRYGLRGRSQPPPRRPRSPQHHGALRGLRRGPPPAAILQTF